MPKRNQTNQVDLQKALIRRHNFKKNNDLGKFSQRRILIVDDQSFNIDAMLIILQYSIKIKDCSSICDSAFDGQQALDRVIKNCKQNKGMACDYDLILMDCNMPHMDGYEST
jgi:CheY-like chemotaxis protein